jgi:hypothetical protein
MATAERNENLKQFFLWWLKTRRFGLATQPGAELTLLFSETQSWPRCQRLEQENLGIPERIDFYTR